MKKIKLGLFLAVLSINALGQDSSWKTKVVNPVLTFQLPTEFQYAKSSFINAFAGELNSNYYALQYYDTTFVPVDNEENFQIALIGFMSGRYEDPGLREYDVLMEDTTVGGAQGLFATFTATNPSQTYKRIYYFVTLANNQFYWFYVYSTTSDKPKGEVNFFFKSIKFDTIKLKERAFKLTAVHLVKKAE